MSTKKDLFFFLTKEKPRPPNEWKGDEAYVLGFYAVT
jgi:hypothetical protein